MAYGLDLSLLEMSLQLTPDERLVRLERLVNEFLSLQGRSRDRLRSP